MCASIVNNYNDVCSECNGIGIVVWVWYTDIWYYRAPWTAMKHNRNISRNKLELVGTYGVSRRKHGNEVNDVGNREWRMLVDHASKGHPEQTQ